MVLEKYARRDDMGKRSKTVRARLTEDLYREWMDYTNELGLTVSEGIYYLIREEIEASKRRRVVDVTTPGPPDDYRATTKSPSVATRKPQKRQGSGRGIVRPYVVQGMAPCPLCDSWVSRSNLSRHMVRHDTTAEEAYNSHQAKIEAMFREKSRK